MEERYHKMKDSVQKFTPFQYGICTFKWNDTDKKYMTRPFVFYIFPQGKYAFNTMYFQVS